MISVDEALERIVRRLPDLGIETVALEAATGRVLAAPMRAAHTQPPFDSSAMDGYAVRSADVKPDEALKVVGTSQAGARFAGVLGSGECVRIFTGAPVPAGADAVIMQEEARPARDHVAFERVPWPGTSIRRAGFDFQDGDELAGAGTLLSPNLVSLAAAANIPALEVRRRPRIAVIATGDELVPPGTPLGDDQITSSNSFGLVPYLRPWAEEVIDLGIVRDDPKAVESALLDALNTGIDVLVTTGGASVGDHDYVQAALQAVGVELDFWKLRMRPGKPLMFGTSGKTLVFGLPGNPVSALVTAAIIIRPALRALLGIADPAGPTLRAPLLAPLTANGPRRHYRRATWGRTVDGQLAVTPIEQVDSSHLTSLARADALIVQTEDDAARDVGELVEVIPLQAFG